MYTGTMHWETGEVSKDTHAALNVDDVVHIDADHPDGVIRVQHDAGDGVDILEAKDKASGVLSMRIDDAGVYRGDVVGASVQGTVVKYGVGAGTDLQTKVIALEADIEANEDALFDQGAEITALETTVQAGTHAETDPGVNSLVKRSTGLGTQINNLYVRERSTGYSPAGSWPPAGLTFTQGYCTGGLDVLQDARLNFQPYDANDDAILTRIFSFGRAVPEGERRNGGPQAGRSPVR